MMAGKKGKQMKTTLLLNIQSAISPVIWNIDAEKELEEMDVNFIKHFNPTIYHNDLECYLWSFDTKLPSGRWLENIRFANDFTSATALIL